MRRLLFTSATFLLVACTALPNQMSQQPPSLKPLVSPSSIGPAGEGNSAAITGTGAVHIDERLLPSGGLEIGSPAAPVSLLLFTNHSCAYCRDFQNDLMPQLTKDYIESGKVRMTIVPYVLQKYSDSQTAAAFLICAARQGKGMAMHTLLFNQDVGSAQAQSALAGLQLNTQELSTCTQDEGIRATIEAQQSMARSLGITLVPSYFINGMMHVGLPEYADLRGEIEEQLKASR